MYSIIYPIVLSTLVLLGLAGCSGGGEEGSIEPPPSIDLSELLPEEWSFREYEEINIDENPQWVERLIFFYYSKNGGSNSVRPIGATIYDSQHDGRLQTGEDEQMPNQASAMLVPYRLLPSYWEGGGQGFVAQSGEVIETNLVTRLDHRELGRAVQRLTSTPTPSLEEAEATPIPRPVPAVLPADELIIWGGTQTLKTRMTVVWWKNIHEGYGFTQVYAPGGLYDMRWEDDRPAENPVRWLRGSWPRYDRSMFCYEIRYTRALEPARDGKDPWQRAVQYVATPLGLTFCHGTPTHPFYPESVVLAYLLDPENSSHLLDGPQGSLSQEILGDPHTYYVDNILTSPTISIIDNTKPVETYVCVELVKSDGTPLPEQLAPYQDKNYPIFYQTQRQLLNFRLSHDEPEIEFDHSSDRLKIISVSEINSPSSDHIINDCDHYVKQGD